VSALPAGAPAPARPASPARPTPRRPAPGRPPASPAGRRAKRPARSPLRVVQPARRRRRSRAPLLILSGVIVASLLVGIVTLQALVSQTSFRMQDLQARTGELQQQYGQLKAQAAALSAPSRIAAAAHRQGMVLPNASQVQTLRVPGVTSPSSASNGSAVPPSAALKPVIGGEP
jgi:cell division protein FtsL